MKKQTIVLNLKYIREKKMKDKKMKEKKMKDKKLNMCYLIF